MIDNITLSLPQQAPVIAAMIADGKPFEYHGLNYYPKYTNGSLFRYEADLRNLKVMLYPNRIYLKNSLHKFFAGTNGNDFRRSDLIASIEAVSNATGFDWNVANVVNLEYGCNIRANADNVFQSLLTYKTREFLPMVGSGKVIGKKAEAEDYVLKGYNKTLQALLPPEKIKIPDNIFRWEIVTKRSRYLTKLLAQSAIAMESLLQEKQLELLAKDAIQKFQKSKRKTSMSLSGLTTKEKLIVAAINDIDVYESLKKENARALKEYDKIYRQIMAGRNLNFSDETELLIAEKLYELLAN